MVSMSKIKCPDCGRVVAAARLPDHRSYICEQIQQQASPSKLSSIPSLSDGNSRNSFGSFPSTSSKKPRLAMPVATDFSDLKEEPEVEMEDDLEQFLAAIDSENDDEDTEGHTASDRSSLISANYNISTLSTSDGDPLQQRSIALCVFLIAWQALHFVSYSALAKLLKGLSLLLGLFRQVCLKC